MELREANIESDLENLAEMNHSLISDEGHRNMMGVPQLRERMKSWLRTEYEAQIITDDGNVIGYCLWREFPGNIYIRQLFIKADFRRKGFGRNAIRWLRNNKWDRSSTLRIEVLIGNESGLKFWRKAGFEDYCITMEYNDA